MQKKWVNVAIVSQPLMHSFLPKYLLSHVGTEKLLLDTFMHTHINTNSLLNIFLWKDWAFRGIFLTIHAHEVFEKQKNRQA